MTDRASVDKPVRYFPVIDDRTATAVSSEVIVRLERTCKGRYRIQYVKPLQSKNEVNPVQRKINHPLTPNRGHN
jgi:hypothetical protein